MAIGLAPAGANRESLRTPLRFRLIAAAFAIGSLVHFTALLASVVLGRHMPPYPAWYPAWRHAAFTLADLTIACTAARYPRFLVAPLTAFVVEQLSTHGTRARPMWAVGHHLDLYDLALFACVIIAAQHALASRATSAAAPPGGKEIGG